MIHVPEKSVLGLPSEAAILQEQVLVLCGMGCRLKEAINGYVRPSRLYRERIFENVPQKRPARINAMSAQATHKSGQLSRNRQAELWNVKNLKAAVGTRERVSYVSCLGEASAEDIRVLAGADPCPE